MNKQALCRQLSCISNVSVFNAKRCIKYIKIPIDIIICPKILILQRFCFPDCNEISFGEIVITIFNYERNAYQGLFLTHSIYNKPSCDIVKTMLNIDYLPPLSCKCFVLDICRQIKGNAISKVVLSKCFNGFPEQITESLCAFPS